MTVWSAIVHTINYSLNGQPNNPANHQTGRPAMYQLGAQTNESGQNAKQTS